MKIENLAGKDSRNINDSKEDLSFRCSYVKKPSVFESSHQNSVASNINITNSKGK
jgi:hypothetical protein